MSQGALRSLGQPKVDNAGLIRPTNRVMAKPPQSGPLVKFDDLAWCQSPILCEQIDGLDYLVLDAPELFDRARRPLHQHGKRRSILITNCCALPLLAARANIRRSSTG